MDIDTTLQQLGIMGDEKFSCLAPGICFLMDEFKAGNSKAKRSNDLMKCLVSIVDAYKKTGSDVSKDFAISKAIKCGETWNVFDSQSINTAVNICKLFIEIEDYLDKDTPVEINVIMCKADMPDELKELLLRKDKPVADAVRNFRTAKIDPSKIM